MRSTLVSDMPVYMHKTWWWSGNSLATEQVTTVLTPPRGMDQDIRLDAEKPLHLKPSTHA